MNKEKDINKRFKLHQTWNWIKHPSTWQCYLPSWLCEVLLELLRHCGMNILFALDSCDPAVVQGGPEIKNQSEKRKMFNPVQEYFSKLCQPTAVIVYSLWLFFHFPLTRKWACAPHWRTSSFWWSPSPPRRCHPSRGSQTQTRLKYESSYIPLNHMIYTV